MGNGLRAIMRRILTPSISATLLDNRGFHKKNPEAVELLETVGAKFLQGYGEAVEATSAVELEQRLEPIEPRFRGFAFEGAAMGLAVLDGLPFGRRDHIERLLAGPGARHLYMAYVGVGWAMARLPKFRWPAPDGFDPLLRWLVLDGYGFHQAYFHTKRYVDEQYQAEEFAWPGGCSYSNRAIDQGIGRALWFVGGTDASVVATMIDNFPESRRPDLYSGTGLAATYAGGADPAELRVLEQRAGVHRPCLAQGSAFAAEARMRAGLDVAQTGTATEIFCGMSPEDAAEVTQQIRPATVIDGELPAYELWRQRIADELATVGGVIR